MTFNEFLSMCISCYWNINQICWLEILFCYWTIIKINFIWGDRAILVRVAEFQWNILWVILLLMFELTFLRNYWYPSIHYSSSLSLHPSLYPFMQPSMCPSIHPSIFIHSLTQQIVMGVYFLLDVATNMGGRGNRRSERLLFLQGVQSIVGKRSCKIPGKVL